MKRTLLTIVAFFACLLVVQAQDYSRYNIFREEAVKLIAQGKLVEAKAKLETIKKTCKGAIPENNDIDALILKCIVISPSARLLQFEWDDEEEQCVSVTSNMGSFKVVCNSDWCHVKKTQSFLYVKCDVNEMPKERTATINLSVSGKMATITVEQLGGEVDLVVQPDTVNFPKDNTSEELLVFTNVETWSVDSVPDWIDTQIKTDTLILTAKANNIAMPRSGFVYVVADDKWMPVFVSQAASDTLISANLNELVFRKEESTQLFMITCNYVGWLVLTSDEWVEAWKDGDTVWVMAHDNYSLFSRHGKVRVVAGEKSVDVLVHQYPSVSEKPILHSEIIDVDNEVADEVHVTSFPDGIRVIVYNDDHSVSSVNYTPFSMPVDYLHYTLQAGFENKEAFLNDKQQDIKFEPGLRFATITWAPRTAIGLMSGFVGLKSWGGYAHFQANTPFVNDFTSEGENLSGYNLTIGPVFQYRKFPYVGVYAGLGVGCYLLEPHIGFDYEAGVMGFYKNITLNMGFHTFMVNSKMSQTSFLVGIGGYLKRYYDAQFGYCVSDSRRWASINYIFRPKENGKGVMIGDIGKGKARAYLKAMYLQPENSDSINIKNLEPGLGIVFTPMSSIIDLCLGASVAINLEGMETQRFQGIGVEVGTILNVWRIPLTVFLHETDLLGERRLYVDFGIGFHLGKFGNTNSTYK